MEAASKVATSSQGRLRQQLLNSEQGISNLDELNYMPNYQQPRQSYHGMAGGPPASAGGQVSTHASMSGSGSIQSFQQQQYMQYQQQIQQHVPQQIPQHQQREQYLSNEFDIPMVTPKNNVNSSRKGSLTSQSAVNRLFRRNKPGMNSGPMHFDENDGADIGDLSAGNVSFEDIRHMRDKGPYGLSAVGKPSDSAPIIPTLGAGNNLMGRSAQNNNIQYRKQMNHQKKLAYLQGARANSMATSYNPMQGQQQPHTYLMQAGNNGRMMSLGGGQPQQGPPRAMSLSANAMLQGGPRAMSMNRPPPQQQQYMNNMNQYPVNQMNGMNGPRQQIPTRNGQFPIGIANGPRANSLQQGSGQFQGQGPGPAGPYSQQGYQQQYARTGSLQNGPMPINKMVPQNFNNNVNNFNNNVGNPQGVPPNMQALPPIQQQYQNHNIQKPHSIVNPQAHVSNESLMNVVEEEEEPRSLAPPKSNQSTPIINKYVDKSEVAASSNKNIRKSMDLRTAMEQTAANLDEEDDEDVVYKFDNDEETALSRLPTLNKNNSMRLRKLDLFDNEPSEATPLRTVTSDARPKVSPSFNITRKGNVRNAEDEEENRESMLFNDDELEYDKGRRLSHRNKLETLGASAAKENNSNNTTFTKDVFVTAPDFNSPQKDFSVPTEENSESEENKKNQDNIDEIKMRGSPVLNAVKNPVDEDLNAAADSDSTSILSNSRTNSLGSKHLQKHSSIQNLVANTAFSKFRSSSISSENGLPPNLRSTSTASHGSANGTFMSPSVRSASKFRSESPLPPIPNDEPVEDTSLENEFVNNSDNLIKAESDFKVTKNIPSTSEADTATTSKTEAAPALAAGATFESDTTTSSKKPGRRAPPSSMLLPVEINEEKKSKEPAQVPLQKFSSMLLPLDLDDDRNSPISLRGDNSIDPASDAPGTSSSKFSSSEKTTFDSSKDNINMSETLSVYNSSDLNETMSLKEDKNLLGSVNGSAIGSARESNAAISSSTSTTSDVTKTPILEESETFGSESKKSTPRSFSLKSRNIMNSLKRLPGRRTSQSTLNVDEEVREASSPSTSKTRNRFSSGSFGSSKKEAQPLPSKPFKFTKEELAIMNCNNELLNELELVTTELASAVQREISLENRLRGGSSPIGNKFTELASPNPNTTDSDVGSISQYQQQIAVLQDKVNKERRLRFISEEHALLMENGITPSPIKLNYEKTEIYRQLLLKNDEINQLQDRLEEYERKYENIDGDQIPNGDGYNSTINHDTSSLSAKNNNTNSNSMLESYNELLRENTDLKFKIIPDLEKKLQQEQLKPAKDHGNGQRLKRSSYNGVNGMSKQLSLSTISNELGAVDGEDDFYDEEYEFNQGQLEIQKLKNQREELREAISKLSAEQSYESKVSQEKIKTLEAKLMDANLINEMLSKRIGASNGNVTLDEDNDRLYKERPMNNTSASNLILHSKGARLQGFNVVASTNTLFDT